MSLRDQKTFVQNNKEHTNQAAIYRSITQHFFSYTPNLQEKNSYRTHSSAAKSVLQQQLFKHLKSWWRAVQISQKKFLKANRQSLLTCTQTAKNYSKHPKASRKSWLLLRMEIFGGTYMRPRYSPCQSSALEVNYA
jgi:hypothetical protein